MSMNDFACITNPDVDYLPQDDELSKQLYERMWNRPEVWDHITYEESVSVPSLDPDSYDNVQVSPCNGFPKQPCILSQPPAKKFVH